MSKVAVVLIRGLVGVRGDIKDTLHMLHLRKKHACHVAEDTPSLRGMLKKVQGFVTFGTISDEVYNMLVEKRKSNYENVFFLAPPVGGFERKGIKRSFVEGGALGDRKDKMGDLIKKMM